jgi:hypothetical protein
LIQFVPLRIAIEFRQPEFPPMRWRGAVFATFVPMPKTAVDKDDGFVFRQNDVGADVADIPR